jgi:MYXO-CTERM domain-containing protein
LSCTPDCEAGSVCVNGQCEVLDCNLEVCRDRSCPTGQACNPTNGLCIPDPCATTECPTDFRCQVVCGGVAVCTAGTPGQPDPTVEVLATGGGGFSCEIGSVARKGSDAWWIFLAGVLGLAFRRRKKR